MDEIQNKCIFIFFVFFTTANHSSVLSISSKIEFIHFYLLSFVVPRNSRRVIWHVETMIYKLIADNDILD